MPVGAARPGVEQKLPVGHATQVGCPDRGCTWPAEHGVQDGEDAPELEKEPAGHAPLGTERPADEQKLPAAQGLQDAWLMRS